ncbi:MAG TPA: hypothetical protein VKE74_19020 [Gemmataceae bacterium]|nr:hypothetical protein [Gemmataceae bacterium]
MAETLRVDVPVGFLLPETREITVSVDRPSDAPLAIRLRLIPAETEAVRPEPAYVPVGPGSGRISRARLAREADGYPGHDYGGGD